MLLEQTTAYLISELIFNSSENQKLMVAAYSLGDKGSVQAKDFWTPTPAPFIKIYTTLLLISG